MTADPGQCLTISFTSVVSVEGRPRKEFRETKAWQERDCGKQANRAGCGVACGSFDNSGLLESPVVVGPIVLFCELELRRLTPALQPLSFPYPTSFGA
jgi:hypothetical protein